jgi:ribosomal protein L21E
LIDTNIGNEEPKFRGQTHDVYGMTGRSLAMFLRVG